MNDKFSKIIRFIKELYPDENPVPLHAPRFLGNEKKYLDDCIDSTYVSYVGKYVTEFEDKIKNFTNVKNAIAIVNGTAAIQIMLIAAGIKKDEEIITQSLTFAATAAAIRHANAYPVFVDVDKSTLGLSPESCEIFLKKYTKITKNGLINKVTKRKIAAIMPMHTFGHPVDIIQIKKICENYGLFLFEDAAESLGSYYNNIHTGSFGKASILSFNGNKTITTGGGGMILTDDDDLAEKARHLSTTAKLKHPWAFIHDAIGYNYRLPNINAAIGCSQMEYLDYILQNKRETALLYDKFFSDINITFFKEPKNAISNYWLNTILLNSQDERDAFLNYSNNFAVQTRPAWTLMTHLKPYSDCFRIDVPDSEWLEERIVNIPSSVRIKR
jgi:aminotransferase in exopolysaccharide biosynthesis